MHRISTLTHARGVGEHEPPILEGPRGVLRDASQSPLRYPGSKRKLIPAIRQLIEANVPRPELFVEPFCGGASVSLGLLELNVVERVVLADVDPLIASFWLEAAENGPRLVRDMRREPVTLERWDYWRSAQPRGRRNRALKCLFLNRTTFSGILNGSSGPIGGRAQTSPHKIDCRFNKEGLAKRILQVHEWHREGRIAAVYESDWREAIRRAEYLAVDYSKAATLFYLDPPYVERAERLYRKFFTEQDHVALAAYLTEDTEHRWILSYDTIISPHYRDKPGVCEYCVPKHSYTMQGKNRTAPVAGREVIFTNLPEAPTSRNQQL